MAEPVTTAEVEDVLSSIRRLVGETKRDEQKEVQAEQNKMLVLTPQLRVRSEDGVLRLLPEQEVAPVPEIDGFEEPPLDELAPIPDASEISPDVRLQTIEVKRTTDAEFSDLTAKIAALETAIAKTADQWEPDGVGRDAYAGTEPSAMEWRDDVELDGTGRPVAQASAPLNLSADMGPAEPQSDATLEEQIIDEETLRAMVIEIFHEELQGELGQRITRNVRKLVRQEIHRALAAHRG